MKFRKFLRLLPAVLTFSLASCSFVATDQDTALYIQNVETELDEDGNTVVTIYYQNEDQAPLTFTIPKGETGNGIRSIQQKQSEDGKSTIITISYTDEGKADTVLTIPNGISVVGYRTENEESSGNTLLYFQYSDGSESDPIVIPQGKAGTSISAINASVDDEGNTVIEVVMSDGQKFSFKVPKGQKGETGNGIVSVTGKAGTGDQEGTYTLTFTYTNGDTSEVTFSLPTTSQWYQGEGEPGVIAGVKDGDYYFDTQGGVIYLRENGIWVAKITIPTETVTTYTVQFHWNDDEVITRNAQPVSSSTNTYSYTIEKGQCFATVGEPVPFAVKDGYVFQGWYTTKTPNVTNGTFTDLTPVSGDLNLYTYFVSAA